MTNEELKDELKNKISMALKDSTLQIGFEIICKENVNLRKLLSAYFKYANSGCDLSYIKDIDEKEVKKLIGFKE